MYIQKFQNAAGSKITVTSTATNIFNLINTAQSTTLNNAGFSPTVNAIIIQPEDGDIRYLMDGNTPTATNGFLVSSGQKAVLLNVPLQKLALIRAGGADVAVSLQVGVSDPSESISFSGGSSSSGATMADDAAFTPGTSSVTPIGALADETATDSVNEGDVGIPRMTLNRRLITAGQLLDDGAFGIATDYVSPVGFVADETGTDSVDEGDVGAARMTLDRRTINAGNKLDDAAFGIGTDYVSAMGALADETASDSVDEGDIGVPRMTLNRRLRVANRSVEGPGEPGTAVDSYAHAAISAAANTANQSLIAAPGANKQIWVFGIYFTLDTADGSVSFQDEDDTAISGVMEFSRRGGMSVSPSGNFSMPIWKLATNKALEVDTVTCGVKGSISYAIVSV